MTTVVFWTAFVGVLYVYLGYPALLAAWSRIAPKPVLRRAHTPGVSVIIAARNEAAVLRKRIDNLLTLDYPSSALQIIVVSDGSTDETPAILASYGRRIDVILLPTGGKASALNAGAAAARHEVLVFADARQTFAADALRALVAPLSDPRVGGVSGELVLDCEVWRRAIDGGPPASAPTGATKNGCADRRVLSARRLDRPEPSMRCGASSGRRSHPKRFLTMCSRRCRLSWLVPASSSRDRPRPSIACRPLPAWSSNARHERLPATIRFSHSNHVS